MSGDVTCGRTRSASGSAVSTETLLAVLKVDFARAGAWQSTGVSCSFGQRYHGWPVKRRPRRRESHSRSPPAIGVAEGTTNLVLHLGSNCDAVTAAADTGADLNGQGRRVAVGTHRARDCVAAQCCYGGTVLRSTVCWITISGKGYEHAWRWYRAARTNVCRRNPTRCSVGGWFVGARLHYRTRRTTRCGAFCHKV